MTAVDQPSTRTVGTGVHVGPGQPGTPSADADLWGRIGRDDRPALAEAFRRHGAAGYSVALMITQDRERAQRAVVAAFGGLSTGVRRGTLPSLRLSVLDAVRRHAGVFAPGASSTVDPDPGSTGPRDVSTTLSLTARDVLALAIAGRCVSDDIAQIMGFDRATVHHYMLIGLRHGQAVLDRDAGVAP